MKGTHIIVKNFSQRGRHFVIVQNEDGYYLAIEDKYITNGKINQRLNGFQMFASKKLEDCIKRLGDSVEIEHLVSIGHSKAEAFAMYFHMMDKVEEIEKIFS